MHGLHFEAEVALRDQPMRAMVDLGNEVVIDDNAELLSILVQVLQFLHALTNRLVVVHVLNTSDEVSDLKLLVKLEVEHLGCVKELHVDVRPVRLDLLKHLVEGVEVIGGHRILHTSLTQVDEVEALVTAADRPLSCLAILLLIHHGLAGAARAVEIATVLAVELNVSEVEF